VNRYRYQYQYQYRQGLITRCLQYLPTTGDPSIGKRDKEEEIQQQQQLQHERTTVFYIFMTQNQKHPGHRCRIAWTPAPAPASVGNDAWQWRRRQHPKRVTTRRLASWRERILQKGVTEQGHHYRSILFLLLLHEQTKAFHGRRDRDWRNRSKSSSMYHTIIQHIVYVFIVRVESSQFLFGIKRQYHIITMTIIS